MRVLACLVMLILVTIQPAISQVEVKGLACFSPDGSILASSGNNCTVILWEITTGKQIGQLYKPRKEPYIRRDVWPRQQAFRPICEVFISSFSPDGRLLATQRRYEPMIVWNVQDGRKVAAMSVKDGIAYEFLVNAEFSPDSRYLIALWRGNHKLFRIGKITVWDLATRQLILSVHENQNGGYSKVIISPDSRTLVAFSPPKGYHKPIKMKLWDLRSGKQLATLSGLSAKYSPNGRFLYVSDWEGQGQYIWDIRAGKKLVLKENEQVARQKSK